jgi:hypothetical protein
VGEMRAFFDLLEEKETAKKVPRRNSGDFFVKEESTYF